MNYSARLTLSFLPVIVIAVGSHVAQAAGPSRYLSGTVAYNQSTKLYTYSYTINNSSLSRSIGELALLVDSSGYYVAPDPRTIPHTKPMDYLISEVVSGSIELPPYNIVGTMYAWVPEGIVDRVPPGGSLGGFSFSAPFPPATGSNNNYFLYSYNGRQVVDYGRVVAPDFRGQFVPEPASWLLGAVGGLAALSARRGRRG